MAADNDVYIKVNTALKKNEDEDKPEMSITVHKTKPEMSISVHKDETQDSHNLQLPAHRLLSTARLFGTVDTTREADRLEMLREKVFELGRVTKLQQQHDSIHVAPSAEKTSYGRRIGDSTMARLAGDALYDHGKPNMRQGGPGHSIVEEVIKGRNLRDHVVTMLNSPRADLRAALMASRDLRRSRMAAAPFQ